jgi:hypothetical protein
MWNGKWCFWYPHFGCIPVIAGMFPGGDSGIGSVQFESFGLLAEFAALGCSEIAECTSDHRQQFYEICVAQTAEPAVHELPQVVVQQQYQ